MDSPIHRKLSRRSFLGRVGAVAAAGPLVGLAAPARGQAPGGRATGVVYAVDASGRRAGLPGVKVSNGLTFATTDAQGRYSIDVGDDTTIWVVKPRGYRPPANAKHLPRFFHHHVPAGTPDDDFIFPGIKPTGELPASIDFELEAVDEPEQFSCVLFGDPQPYTVEEALWYSRDVTKAFCDMEGVAFGVGMGDLVGDNLDLHQLYNDANAASGFRWYNVCGNHDIDFMSPTDEHADAAFRRTFGPSTYVFQHAAAHFIVVNNVFWRGFAGLGRDGWPRRGNYEGRLRPEQLELIRQYVRDVPTDEAIVVLMHIPLYAFEGEGGVHTTPQARELMEILSGHPHTFSASGHTHINHHHLAGPDRGYTNAEGKHHVHHNVGAICGSWWKGKRGLDGIPHATQRDGTPRGYALVEFDGPNFTVGYRKLGGRADEQMHIDAPDVARRGEPLPVSVNVFDGGPLSTTRLRVGEDASWQVMTQTSKIDDYYATLHAESLRWAEAEPGRRAINEPVVTDHHWVLDVDTSGLASGLHVIEVETTDAYGKRHAGRRIIRLEDDPRDLAAFDANSIRKPRDASTR